jgi:hypothetical protein
VGHKDALKEDVGRPDWQRRGRRGVVRYGEIGQDVAHRQVHRGQAGRELAVWGRVALPLHHVRTRTPSVLLLTEPDGSFTRAMTQQGRIGTRTLSSPSRVTLPNSRPG